MKFHRKLMSVVALLSLPFRTPAQIQDISGDFDPSYNRIIQCGNVQLTINDNARSVLALCNRTRFDLSLLPNCTDYPQYRSMALMDCILPSPDIGQLLGNYQPDCLLLHSNGSWTFDRVIIRNFPNLKCLAISLEENVTYVLENLTYLQSVQLLFPQAETFPEDFFTQLTNLRIIHVKYGKVRYLPENIFRGSYAIDVLYLCYNRLETLPENIFGQLRNLQVMDLSHNRLTSLPPEIFHALLNLKILFLNNNGLTRLSSTLFRKNINLKQLNVSSNQISFLSEDLLQNSTNLQAFDACRCNISALPETIFSRCSVLSIISLCANKLTRLGSKTFRENRWLQTLSLSDNRIASLPSDIFAYNSRLQEIQLDRNSLASLDRDTFRNATNLRSLWLRGNRLTEIRELFYNTRTLEVLLLDENQIGIIELDNRAGALGQLSQLGLSRNNLTHFPPIKWGAHSLFFVDLSYNGISFVRDDHLPGDNHTRVSLRHNDIRTVSVPRGYVYWGNVQFDHNPFLCDCSLRNFVDAVESSGATDWYICSLPQQFRNRSFHQLAPTHQLCPVTRGCPPCRCHRLKNLSVLVNCSGVGLVRLPSTIPENSSVVDARHNLLSGPALSANWSRVSSLQLDYNRLDPSASWQFPSSLQFLSLRNNGLDKLPEEFMKYVTSSVHLRLDLRGNRFWCNCSSAYLKTWFTKNLEKMASAEGVTCSRILGYNNTVVNSPLINVPLDAFCPVSPAPSVALIVSSTVASLVAVIVVAGLVLFLRYKYTILAYVYVHHPGFFRHSASETDKPFDAFVSYTSCDRDIVLLMLKELEEKFPFFKLCIHERDWLPGHPIISQIESSVRNSEKTVVVLSREFLESVWCETEFQMAYLQCLEDRVDRLIMVVKGTLPARDVMPADMQNLLSTKTYLVWGERWFWEKLRYSLPHYCRHKPPEAHLRVVDEMIECYTSSRII